MNVMVTEAFLPVVSVTVRVALRNPQVVVAAAALTMTARKQRVLGSTPACPRPALCCFNCCPRLRNAGSWRTWWTAAPDETCGGSFAHALRYAAHQGTLRASALAHDPTHHT